MFCHRLDNGKGNAKNAGNIFQNRTRRERAKGDDLRDRFFAVFLSNIVDNLLTLVVGEIDVDIRHTNAVRVKKTFEEQIVLQRVDACNSQGIRNNAPGSAPASRSNHHPHFTSSANKIGDDQKISSITHLPNDSKFMSDS